MNMDCAFPKGTDENNHEEQLLTIFGELNLIWSYVFSKCRIRTALSVS